jgi:hypothetical protein
MSREEIALWAAAIMSATSAWFLRRLVVSIDTFKTETREALGEHSTQLARIDERHRIEDLGEAEILHVHRRRSDVTPS